MCKAPFYLADTPRLDLTEMAMPMVMRKSLAKYMGI